MSFRALMAEKKLEKQYIETQGQIYMDRMEQERSKRKDNKELISE